MPVHAPTAEPTPEALAKRAARLARELKDARRRLAHLATKRDETAFETFDGSARAASRLNTLDRQVAEAERRVQHMEAAVAEAQRRADAAAAGRQAKQEDDQRTRLRDAAARALESARRVDAAMTAVTAALEALTAAEEEMVVLSTRKNAIGKLVRDREALIDAWIRQRIAGLTPQTRALRFNRAVCDNRLRPLDLPLAELVAGPDEVLRIDDAVDHAAAA